MVSSATDQQQQYGSDVVEDRKELREMVERLYAIGLDNRVINLPMIAVMGDTSAGKSSLLTQLSTIEFPADANICTRAPTRLCMTQAATFQARVTVVWQGEPPATATSREFDSSLAKWVTKHEEVTELIRRAQEYLLTQRGKAGRSGVVSDVIQVDVRGPGFDELTVVDLPGLVHSVGDKEEPALIKDVRDLLFEYLQNPRCVVACVVPANNDVHNQKVLEMCKEVDPTQKRTVPIVTKPDLVQEGDEGALLRLMRGEHREFYHGFYMVKCRSTAERERKVSVSEAVAAEEQFFASKHPWCDVNGALNDALKDHFGTRAVRKYLASVQCQMLRDELPKLLEEFNGRLTKCEERLASLGALPPADPVTRCIEYERHVQQVAEAAQHVLRGTEAVQGSSDTWPAKLKAGFDILGASLFSIRPLHEVRGASADTYGDDGTFHWYESQFRVDQSSGRVQFAKRHKEFEDEHLGSIVDVLLPTRKASGGEAWRRARVLNPIDQSDDDDDDAVPKYRCVVLPLGETDFRTDTVEVHEVLGDIAHMTPVEPSDDLREKLRAARTTDLDVFLSPDVFKTVFDEFISISVRPAVMQLVNRLCDELLPLLPDSALHVQGRLSWQMQHLPRLKVLWGDLRTQLLQRARADVMQAVERVLSREDVPYTQNDYFTQTIQRRRFEPLRDAIFRRIGEKSSRDRQPSISRTPGGASGEVTEASTAGSPQQANPFRSRSSVPQSFTPQQIQDMVNGAIEEHVTASPLEANIAEMHNILQAYWRVVAKCLIDDVPKAVLEAVHALPKRLRELSAVTDDNTLQERVVRAFDEPRDALVRREKTKKEAAKLRTAVETLRALA